MKNPTFAIFVFSCIILYSACDNREDTWNPVNLLSGFTLKKENTDSIVYKSINKDSYYDTLKVGFSATYRYKMPRIAECKFNIIYDKAKSECSINTVTNELTYKGLLQGIDSVKIDITDPWTQHKYVVIHINNNADLSPVAVATISQKIVASGYEITVDAGKSYDQDANLGGKIIAYEYTIGNLAPVKTNSAIFADTLLPTQFGAWTIKVRAEDNDNTWGTLSSYSYNVGLSDIDGHIYPVVVIGTKTWMAANLATTKYNDGTAIPNRKDSATWSTSTTGCYGIGSGILYNWYAVTNAKHICPTGWHVPDANEYYYALITYLGGTSSFGPKLKISTWGGDNSSGFSANYTGVINGAGVYNSTSGVEGYWWSTSESGTLGTQAVQLHMSNSGGSDLLQPGVKTDGNAVRCVKD